MPTDEVSERIRKSRDEFRGWNLVRLILKITVGVATVYAMLLGILWLAGVR